MKKFTTSDIKNRIVTKLTTSDQWKSVLKGSAVDSLITSFAEPNAELARYFEYLLREAKWDSARNLTSLLTQAPAIGYKPRRKSSSVGFIMASHDPLFVNAGLPNSGMIDQDDIISALSPYTGVPFTIVKGTQLKSAGGSHSVIVTESVDYTPGLKYVMLPVVEGFIETKSKTLLGNSFEVLIINNDKVEANATPLSGNFFKVYDATRTYTEFESIFLASQDDFAYEVSTDNTITKTRIKFGNGIAGKKPPVGQITVSYLSTKGKSGVIPATFITWNVVQASLPSGVVMTYRNIDGILGGRDQDTMEDIRKRAPNQYLLEGGVTTYDGYKAVIEAIPGVLKAKVFYGVYTDPRTNNSKDTIFYTAIDESGKEYKASFIEPLVESSLTGRNNPLDFYKYKAPRFLHLRLNISGFTSSTSPNLIKDKIYSSLYATYKTTEQEFSESFDPSSVIEQVRSLDPSLRDIGLGLEAICDIKGSVFLPWTSNSNYYIADFNFDPSYQALKLRENNVLHCLRVDVIMPCASCYDSQRTILLIQDTNGTSVTQKQFFYIGDSIDLTNKNEVLKLINNQNTSFPELTNLNEAVKAKRKIDITVTVDINSFTSVSNSLLAEGTIRIPVTSRGELYFDFTASDVEKDVDLLVQAIAQPLNPNIKALYKENIIKIEETTNLKDIRLGGLSATS